jgi:polyhydroxybutyrate depolymerase
MTHELINGILKRSVLYLLVLTLFVFGCSAPQPQKKPTEKKPIMERLERQDIKIGNKRRRFYVFVPESYNGKNPVPLVFDFHGSYSNPKREVPYSDSANLAEKKGFILVALDGIYSARKSWNTTKDPKGVDDIAFIKEVLAIVPGKYNIDEKRIYAMGMSGGARMVSRIGCDLSDIFAAIGPVAGVQFLDDCAPSRAMSVITFHGKKDLVNHYKHQSKSPSYWIHGVEHSVGKWVEANDCDDSAKTTKISDVVTKLTYSNCRDGAEVIFYQIEDGGHTWPGSPITLTASWAGKTNRDIVAIDLIWEFFMAHPMP